MDGEQIAMEKKCYLISADLAGISVGQFLGRYLHFSGAQIRSLKFCADGICVNGVRVRVTRELRAGDLLELRVGDKAGPRGDNGRDGDFAGLRGDNGRDGDFAGPRVENAPDNNVVKTQTGDGRGGDAPETKAEIALSPPEILYEDADLVAVWKPSGAVVHPAHGHYRDTISDCVRMYLQKKGEHAQIRSIGRLDKDTSGVLVFAKNRIAAARLWEQRRCGEFRKEYAALVEGKFAPEVYRAWQTVDAPIGAEPAALNKMCVTPGGKRAVTHYKAVRADEGTPAMRPDERILAAHPDGETSLVFLRLDTGRTHQIRVHMAYIGHPLVGDCLYGHGTDGQHAQLTAWRAALRQPFTGEKIEITR